MRKPDIITLRRQPKVLNLKVVDEVVTVDQEEAIEWARRAAKEEGLFVGGSSGAAVKVSADLAKKVGKDKIIVTILPDSGTRYLSKIYSDQWMKDNGFLD